MNDTIHRTLRQLRLSGLAQSLEVRVQEATANRLSHSEFLELILQDELNTRHQRLLARRVKAAAFHDTRTLEDFDFSFNPSIKRKQIFDLATSQFIREHRDVLFLGNGLLVFYRSIFDVVHDLTENETLSGSLKGLCRYLKPDLLIIDDMGLKQLPKKSGEYLFEIIMRRYENRSTIMTSNRPIEEWGKLIGDVPSATAILDRFLHHAEIIRITGRSYRLKDRGTPKDAIDKESKE
jgi:DNA replication protein DnaC